LEEICEDILVKKMEKCRWIKICWC
jgi:hypothetical protein